ncbi:MAG: hypothetical protein ACOX9C_10970 [Kiritimatiellia bacterium]|jgi:beta-phosphoglucomutase-like phosphatase (HAD superfamily)
MPEKTADKKKKTVVVKRARGLVVDFDYALIDGIGALKKACAKVLEAAGVKADEGAFVRRFFGKNATDALRASLGPEAELEEAAASISADMDEAAETAPANSTIQTICKHVLDANAQVAFVTMRTPGIVEARIAELGLEGAIVLKTDRTANFGEYPDDIWSRAAHALKLNARLCTAIVASATSVLHAMMVGMRTAAFTNPAIGFQDFSGVDFIASPKSGAGAVDAVVGLVKLRALTPEAPVEFAE